MKLHLETSLVHDARRENLTGAISYPIYQSATFRRPGLGQSTGYDYSRSENPTREQLEQKMALIEGGQAGFAFATGMAAISTVLGLFSPGDHIIVSDDLYGGTYRLFEQVYRRYGIEFSYQDTSNPSNVEAAIRPNSRAFFVETPSNPMMKVTDLRRIADMAARAGAILIVDNTFLTPYFQQPLALGADIVVHSGTKYLGGHNDTLAGFVIVDNAERAERIQLLQNSAGTALAPFDSWLILRGLKTLAVRLDRQQANAFAVAEYLKAHPAVGDVHYVGLPEHVSYEVSCRQARGFGGMISFTVKNADQVKDILSRVRVISFAESLGGVESLITYPLVQTHAAIPEEMRRRIGVDEHLLRLSVGIEAAEDLTADLDHALGG